MTLEDYVEAKRSSQFSRTRTKSKETPLDRSFWPFKSLSPHLSFVGTRDLRKKGRQKFTGKPPPLPLPLFLLLVSHTHHTISHVSHFYVFADAIPSSWSCSICLTPHSKTTKKNKEAKNTFIVFLLQETISNISGQANCPYFKLYDKRMKTLTIHLNIL